jgi:hypothetical protein
MTRSSNNLDQKLKKLIQPRIKKYNDYTYQKLVQEEETIRDKISDMSSEIKTIEFNIKDVKKDLSKASELVSEVNARMNKEEQESKNNIVRSGTLPYPEDPLQSIFNGRNIICFILAGFVAFAFGQDIAEGIGFILFMPGFFVLFRVIAYWILKDSDDQANREYLAKIYEYNNSIRKKFKPSPDYLRLKKVVEKVNPSIGASEVIIKKYYTKLGSVEFESLVSKKILTELKRFKKRASERERTSKINAFEMKNRSGAQNIKEKLLKPIRGKSNWSCPYCTNLSDVNLAEADHIHPVNKGGLTTLQNMVLICKKCNSKKTNLMLRVFCKKQGYDYNGVCERLEKLGKDV